MAEKSFDINKGLQRAQWICSRQEKCISDIKTKLISWGAKDAEIRTIIDSLVSENYLNQGRFAKIFASEKARFNKWGPKKIEQALRLKGIEKDDIESAIEGVSESFNNDSLQQILTNKRRNLKAKNNYELKNKLIRFALSRGYDYSQVIKVLNNVIGDVDD